MFEIYRRHDDGRVELLDEAKTELRSRLLAVMRSHRAKATIIVTTSQRDGATKHLYTFREGLMIVGPGGREP